jgi:hypothetical protein
MTLAEIAEHPFKAHGERFVPSVVWRFFDRRGITFKKNISRQRAGRPDVAAERAAWKASQPEIDIHRLVFIDETRASTKMARLYGRSPYGQRCVAAIPHGHRKTTTFVGALRATGMTAPIVLDGPRDGLAFEAYVTHDPETEHGDGMALLGGLLKPDHRLTMVLRYAFAVCVLVPRSRRHGRQPLRNQITAWLSSCVRPRP